jgi:hypothetical protein
MLAALLFASSCQHDWDGGGGTTSNNESFLLKINVPGSNINTRMTIPSETGEDDVQVLHVLFFQATGAQQFIDVVEIRDRDTDGSLTGDKLDLSTPLLVRFREAPLLNNSTHYKLLVVANIDAYINNFSFNSWKANFVGQSYNNVLNNVGQLDHLPLTGTTPDFNLPDEQIASDRLLMSARAEKPANREEVSVPLTRAIVRVDVNMNSRLADDYKLVSASIWNVPMNASIWNSANDDFINMISGKVVQRVEALTGFEGNGFKGLLYTFENRQRNVSQNDRHTTAVVLGIEYRGTVTYHRVNVSLPFAGQTLERNTVHNVTVNRVLGDGATTEEGAYNSYSSMLQVSVNNSDMDSRGVILIDGDDVLVIPTNRIVFTPEGDMREYTIFTYSPDPSKRLGATNITMDPGLSTILSGNSLTVSAAPSVDARYGVIELVFGNIHARIDVVQESSFVEFLELNLRMNDISTFSNNVPPGGVLMSTPAELDLPDFVQVTASGEWIATMYNQDAFGFAAMNGTPITSNFITGDANNNTFKLRAISQNTEDFIRYGFVIVSLVSNPSINRVLVLKQYGTDIVVVFAYDNQIDPLPDPRTYFTARGNVVTNRGSNTNEFLITHSDTGLSSIEMPQGSSIFTYTTEPGASNTETKLTITTIADYNSSLNTRQTGRIVLRSAYGGFAAIELEQGFFTLSISPNAAQVIPHGGGNSGAITVTSTETSGPDINSITVPVNWNAVFTNTYSGIWHNDAMIVWGNTGAAPSIDNTSGGNQGTFTVTYPRLRINEVYKSPTSTVTIGIDGTGITLPAPLTVQQTARTPKDEFYVLSARTNALSSWNTPASVANRNNFGRLRNEIASTTNFGGESAVIRSGEVIFSPRGAESAANQPWFPDDGASQTGTQIPELYISNNTYPGSGGAGRISNWLQTGNTTGIGRVLIMIHEDHSPATTGESGVFNTNAGRISRILSPFGPTVSQANYVVDQSTTAAAAAATTAPTATVGGGINTNRVVSGNANTSAIHNFLFRDGPFTNGTDISSQVALTLGSRQYAWATSVPNTSMPIIRDNNTNNNRILLSICTTYNVVYMGAPHLFGTTSTTDWTNPANDALVKNLAAWITLRAQYGAEFTDYVNALYNARMNP